MFDRPIIGERFFGREEVLELLARRVSALKDGYRQNIAFTGQSLAGKTTILHHFLYTIKDEDFIAIYIEIVKEPFRSFANRFIATLLYNSLLKKGYSVEPILESVIEKAQKVMPRTSMAIKQVYSLIEKGEMDDAYSNLLGLTSALKDEIKMPCIVILDEFDNLESMGIKNPFLNFGKMIMVQKDTMYIVTSSRNQAIKKILSEKLSLLFGNFEIVKIAGFNLKTAGAFLDSKLDGFEIDHPLKKFLMAFTDGNPYYLNHLASRAKAIALNRMTSFIDSGIISQALYEQVYESTGSIHQYLINYILETIDSRLRDQYMSILTAVANGKKKHLEIARYVRSKPAEVSKCLAHLVELGFISKNGVFYRIEDVVLEFWLKHIYQKRKTTIVDDIFNRAKTYEKQAQDLVLSHVEDMARDTISKLSDLFGCFSNELVTIDFKSIKLPHFTRVETKPLNSIKRAIVASYRGSSWVMVPYEAEVTDNDIIDYMRFVKGSGYKVSNKVIIPLRGIDENTKLLAKELKIAIWDTQIINMLLSLYGKRKIVLL